MRVFTCLIMVILWAVSSAAWACSYGLGPDSVQELADESDVIFIGYVEDVSENYKPRRGHRKGERLGLSSLEYHTVTFRVVKTYKGEEAGIVEIEALAASNCTVPFSPNALHVIAAKRQDNGVYTLGFPPDENNAVGITRYFETGEDNYAPSKTRCYMDIKNYYNTQNIPSINITLSPVCQKHVVDYDRRYRNDDMAGK